MPYVILIKWYKYHMRFHILSTSESVLSLLSVFLVNGGLLAIICSTNNLHGETQCPISRKFRGHPQDCPQSSVVELSFLKFAKFPAKLSCTHTYL